VLVYEQTFKNFQKLLTNIQKLSGNIQKLYRNLQKLIRNIQKYSMRTSGGGIYSRSLIVHREIRERLPKLTLPKV
jgi:hypothetical protein